MDCYIPKEVILTDDEAEAYAEFLKLMIWTQTKYYFTDAKLEEDDYILRDIKKDIERYWSTFEELIKGKRRFDDNEEIRLNEIDLSFGIFSVLYDEANSYEIDNPWFLYDVLSAWKKFADYMEQKRKCEKCEYYE